MGKLGEAWVQVGADLKPLDSGLSSAERHIKGWVGGLAAGVSVAAITAALADAGKKAADLGETLSKTKNTFGSDSRLIIDFADRMADKFGLVKTETIDAATGIGLIGKAAGMADGASARLGVDMAKIAADLSSFHNVPMVDALMAIRSGLVGESEPLRRFGILLNEDAVKAEAMRLGLKGVGKELTESQKVQARMSLIRNAPALGPVNGDLERTADSAANQMRKFWGDLENAKAKFGEALLGPMTEAIKLATELGTAISGIGKDGAGNAAEWAKAFTGALRMVLNDSKPLLDQLTDVQGLSLQTFGFRPSAALQAQADRQAGVKRGLGSVDANGNAWDTTTEAGAPGGDATESNLGKQIRERREAEQKRQAAEAAKAEADRQKQFARMSDEELRLNGKMRIKGKIEDVDVSGRKDYEARRRQSEADYRAGKGGLLPGPFDQVEGRRNAKATRLADQKETLKDVGQTARQFGEQALHALFAAPKLASSDRGTAATARAQLAALPGLGNSPAARLLAGAGAGLGAMARGIQEGKEQKARMGPSQTMGIEQYLQGNLSAGINAAEEKRLAEQEKTNAKLDEAKDVLIDILEEAKKKAGTILRGRS